MQVEGPSPFHPPCVEARRAVTLRFPTMYTASRDPGVGRSIFRPYVRPYNHHPYHRNRTIAIANDRFNHPRVQDRCHEMVPGKHGPPFRLAARVLRAHCSHRGRIDGHPRIRPRQSRSLERGREQPCLAELRAMKYRTEWAEMPAMLDRKCLVA